MQQTRAAQQGWRLGVVRSPCARLLMRSRHTPRSRRLVRRARSSCPRWLPHSSGSSMMRRASTGRSSWRCKCARWPPPGVGVPEGGRGGGGGSGSLQQPSYALHKPRPQPAGQHASLLHAHPPPQPHASAFALLQVALTPPLVRAAAAGALRGRGRVVGGAGRPGCEGTPWPHSWRCGGRGGSSGKHGGRGRRRSIGAWCAQQRAQVPHLPGRPVALSGAYGGGYDLCVGCVCVQGKACTCHSPQPSCNAAPAPSARLPRAAPAHC